MVKKTNGGKDRRHFIKWKYTNYEGLVTLNESQTHYHVALINLYLHTNFVWIIHTQYVNRQSNRNWLYYVDSVEEMT